MQCVDDGDGGGDGGTCGEHHGDVDMLLSRIPVTSQMETRKRILSTPSSDRSHSPAAALLSFVAERECDSHIPLSLVRNYLELKLKVSKAAIRTHVYSCFCLCLEASVVKLSKSHHTHTDPTDDDKKPSQNYTLGWRKPQGYKLSSALLVSADTKPSCRSLWPAESWTVNTELYETDTKYVFPYTECEVEN